MYPLWETNKVPPPDLSVLEEMNLDGDEYHALKKNLSQTIHESVNLVSYNRIEYRPRNQSLRL